MSWLFLVPIKKGDAFIASSFVFRLLGLCSPELDGIGRRFALLVRLCLSLSGLVQIDDIISQKLDPVLVAQVYPSNAARQNKTAASVPAAAENFKRNLI